MRAAPQRLKSRVTQARRHSSKVLIVGVLALTSAATAQTGRLETAFAGGNAATDGASLQTGDSALNELVAALFPGPDDNMDPGEPIYLAQAGIYVPGTGSQGVGGFPSLTPTTPSPYRPLPQAAARQRPFVASIAVTETLTNNVNLAPAGSRRGDLVSQIVPQIKLFDRGPYSFFEGFLAAPILLYVRTGSKNDRVYPSGTLLGNVEAVPHLFFVEGAVSVSQQFLSPFGAQPVELSNATQNRYTSEVYRISPYILHTTPGDYRYEVRNNNVWTNYSGTAVNTRNAYYDQWLANIASPVAPYGWVADYVGDWVTFKGQRPLVTQVGRGELVAQVEPELQVTAIGGYEHNRFTLTSYSGPVYGASARWRPTPRANLVARWEHRFFGPSYLFAFQNHGPLSVVNLRYSRNITTYPQQYLSLPAGADVPLLLNSIFSSSIPDPAQRQTFIDNLIEQNGLPTTLTSPVNLYTEQINLVEQARATVGLLGARNALLATGFYVRYQPITASGMAIPPSILFPGNNSTQRGVALTWAHNLTPAVTMTVNGTLLRTTLDVPPFGTTKQGYVTFRATRFLSTDTSVFVGARYQKANSDFGVNYDEAAIFAGLNHVFR